jgi:alkanesulfonate monooxygenase SsuD/methylene tetrahydromethanopterin reductase-like flavin-dependent oxidoreductase (luciferase family)
MTAVLVGETEAELRVRSRQRGEKEGTDGDALLSEPPRGWIMGTVERAADQLIALREAGVSRVMCQHLVHDDLDMVALIGERLAPLVA